VTLTLTPPPAVSRGRTLEQATALLSRAVAEKEAHYREAHEAQGRRFAGRRAVRKQDPFASPASAPSFRQRNPRIKCADPSLRQAAIRQLQAFWDAYAQARERSRARARNVVYPAGTYQLRLLVGVPCAPT
jgi:hypothetical protein